MLTFILGVSITLNISLVCAVLYLRNENKVLHGKEEQTSIYSEIMAMDLDEPGGKSPQECLSADKATGNMLVAAAGKRDRYRR